MNQRKAKKLRRMAKTILNRRIDYKIGQPPRYQEVGFSFVKVAPGVPTTLANCTRKIYKQMKRNS